MTGLALIVALLNPASLYHLPGKPVEVAVNLDYAKQQKEPAAKLLLLSPTGAIEARVDLPEGDSHDLGKLLPGIWDGKTHYVQPVTAKDAGVGPAIVVVPLWPADPNVKRALMERNGGKPMGLRTYVETRVVFDTTLGKIVMSLSPEAAPNTTASFMHLAGNGFYDGVIFHRTVPTFVIQGGDPSGTGLGGPGYLLDLEAGKKHKRGVLSMARSGDPNSAGSQFFICLQDGGSVPALDPRPGSPGYTAFGEVVEGMEVVDKIAALPREGGAPDGRPVDPPAIKRATLIAAPPRTVTPDGP